MATDDIAATLGSTTPGIGKFVATHNFVEDGKTKQLQRIVSSTPGGADVPFGAGATTGTTPRIAVAYDLIDLVLFTNQPNVSGTVNGGAVAWPGYRGFWSAEGTWTGGGSIQLEWRRLSSTAWLPIEGATLSANGAIPIGDLGVGEVRAAITGAVTSVSSNLQRTG